MNRKGIQFGVKDTWSLDATLSPIILSALKKFKEVVTDPKHASWMGVPSEVIADLYPELEGNPNDGQLEEASKIWLEIIDKMIYAFNLKNEPNLKDYNFKFNTWSEGHMFKVALNIILNQQMKKSTIGIKQMKNFIGKRFKKVTCCWDVIFGHCGGDRCKAD